MNVILPVQVHTNFQNYNVMSVKFSWLWNVKSWRFAFHTFNFAGYRQFLRRYKSWRLLYIGHWKKNTICVSVVKMSGVPENAPQRKCYNLKLVSLNLGIIHKFVIIFTVDCPGTQSEDAGKASACAGCPNQNICASGKWCNYCCYAN